MISMPELKGRSGIIFVMAALNLAMLSVTTSAETFKFRPSIRPAPPSLSAEVAFFEPSGNNILDAEETGRISITVRNDGAGDAFDVKAILKADREIPGLTMPKEVDFGRVGAKGSVTRVAEVRAAEGIPTGDIRISIEFREQGRFEPDPVSLSFRTKSFEPPRLIVADVGISDANGNGKIDPGEVVEATVRVQNVGTGDAWGVVVDVKPGANVFLAGGSGRTEIGRLASGQYRDVKFSFYTNRAIRGGERIPLDVRISEGRPQFAAAKTLELFMNEPSRQERDFVIAPVEGPSREAPKIAGGLSVDVDIKIPLGLSAGKYDVAVIIGNRNYSAPGMPEVAYADRDAAVMRDYLVSTFGFDLRNIIFERDAGVSKFQEIFGTASDPRGKLYRFVKPGVSRVFVYYVGHGAPDLESQEAYFVPSDANPNYLGMTGYRLKTLYENLSKLPAKGVTIVLDACFSGNSDKGSLFKDISPAMVKVKKEYEAPRNSLLFTGGAPDQVSSWYPEKRHSLFTYYFLKGIGGAADTSGTGVITAGMMKAYLAENVPYMAQRITGVRQTPVMTGEDGEVIVRLKK